MLFAGMRDVLFFDINDDCFLAIVNNFGYDRELTTLVGRRAAALFKEMFSNIS